MNTRVEINAHRSVYPTPAGLVTSMASDGIANIVTLGEIFNLSLGKPPIVGIAIRKATYSHKLISESGEFVVNHPTSKLIKHLDRIGSVSGRDIDKFSDTGLTPVPATHVAPPLIAECPVNLECKVLGIEEIGDHDLIKGEVVLAHADPEVLTDGKIDYAKLDPVVLMLNSGVPGVYYQLGQRLSGMREKELAAR